jgi:hypothetical protein
MGKTKFMQQEYDTYFETYHVLPALRARYASLSFKGIFALWLRNVLLQEWVKWVV